MNGAAVILTMAPTPAMPAIKTLQTGKVVIIVIENTVMRTAKNKTLLVRWISLLCADSS